MSRLTDADLEALLRFPGGTELSEDTEGLGDGSFLFLLFSLSSCRAPVVGWSDEGERERWKGGGEEGERREGERGRGGEGERGRKGEGERARRGEGEKGRRGEGERERGRNGEKGGGGEAGERERGGGGERERRRGRRGAGERGRGEGERGRKYTHACMALHAHTSTYKYIHMRTYANI